MQRHFIGEESVTIEPSFLRTETETPAVPVQCRGMAEKLRIGLVVGDFPVISETFVINQAAGLVEAGHDVAILALDGQRPAEATTHAMVARFDLEARVRRPAADRLLVAPFRPKEGDGDVWTKRRRAAAFAAQAITLAAEPRFDVVHCQFATLGLEIGTHLRLGSLRTRKLVVHVRGRDVSSFVEEKGRDVYRALFARADLLIANCEFFRRRAIDLGAPPERVVVIGSAIDCALFAPKPYDPPTRPGPVKLVTVGRLVEKKGLDYAVRGIARAVAAGHDLSFEIIGEGPVRPRLERLVGELGMGGRIALPGAMTHERVVERLSASDVMLATSVRARDGDEDAPVNSLKEAMAVGLPVLATRHGGIPELVEDGAHGVLVPEGDVEAIADGIARLLAERPRWPAMGAAGRAKVVALYDQPVVIQRLLDAYRGLSG